MTLVRPALALVEPAKTILFVLFLISTRVCTDVHVILARYLARGWTLASHNVPLSLHLTPAFVSPPKTKSPRLSVHAGRALGSHEVSGRSFCRRYVVPAASVPCSCALRYERDRGRRLHSAELACFSAPVAYITACAPTLPYRTETCFFWVICAVARRCVVFSADLPFR